LKLTGLFGTSFKPRDGKREDQVMYNSNKWCKDVKEKSKKYVACRVGPFEVLSAPLFWGR
jgi:hypothetical protein